MMNQNAIGEKLGWSSLSLQQRCQSFRTFVYFQEHSPLLNTFWTISENLLQSETP